MAFFLKGLSLQSKFPRALDALDAKYTQIQLDSCLCFCVVYVHAGVHLQGGDGYTDKIQLKTRNI